jgi:hypothetical protein
LIHFLEIIILRQPRNPKGKPNPRKLFIINDLKRISDFLVKMKIPMRQSFFSFLFVGIILSGIVVSAQNDTFLEAENVPFPFTNESVKDVMKQSTFAQDALSKADSSNSASAGSKNALSEDAILAENAGGYVPDFFKRIAPEPPIVLRPRYRSNSSTTKSKKQTTATAQLSPSKNTQNTQDLSDGDKGQKTKEQGTNRPQHPIRQVSSDDAPAPPAEFADPIPITQSNAENKTENNADSSSATPLPSLLKFPISLSPQKRTPLPSRDQYRSSVLSPYSGEIEQPESRQQSPYVINNKHTCDELTCGNGACSIYTEKLMFKHLNPVQRHGLCDCCGFLRCVNKTAGAWYYDGWFSVGSFMNMHQPNDRNNIPFYYNDRNNETVMNQLYLTFGRRVNPRGGRWDVGGRIDLLYGTDYFYTSSLGLETRQTLFIPIYPNTTLDPLQANLHWNSNSGVRRTGTAAHYGLSLPQAYAELLVPFGYGMTVKAGHFYSGMGIESAMSPNNFFYSHSYSFMHGTPTTLTGVTSTLKLGSGFSAVLGFSRGWNVWDKTTNTISGLGGLSWESVNKQTSLSFLLHSGEESLRKGDNRTNYTLTLQHQLAPHWNYALEHSFGNEKNGALINYNGQLGKAQWFSVAQYLQWEWSERFAVGFRGEWFRDSGHARILKQPVNGPFWSLSGEDYFEITLGANWKPTRFITIRPEIRYDWSNITQQLNTLNRSEGIYNGHKDMFSFAIDGIFRF